MILIDQLSHIHNSGKCCAAQFNAIDAESARDRYAIESLVSGSGATGYIISLFHTSPSTLRGVYQVPFL